MLPMFYICLFLFDFTLVNALRVTIKGAIRRDFGQYFYSRFCVCYANDIHSDKYRPIAKRCDVPNTKPFGIGSAGIFGLTNLYSFVATWTLQPNNESEETI